MKKICLVDVDNYEKARGLILDYSRKERIVVVVAKNDDFNRKVLENDLVNVLFSVEGGKRKDRLKQRDSGLNHVLCKIANKNKVAIGIDFKNFLIKDEFVLSSFLGRLQQNIKLCNKHKVKMVLLNTTKDAELVNSLLLSLGMSTSMAKYAIENKMLI